jgi:hypothetical protein
VHRSAGEGVDIDRDRLARPHIGQLGLLVIRGDINGLQRHDRHQLRAGLDILADPQGAPADRAVDRGRDRRIAEVELGLMLYRLLLGERRVGLGELRLEDADLLLGSPDPRRVVLQRGLFFANVGGCLLRVLHCAPAVPGQLGVALVILLRIDKRRLIRSDLLPVLLDNELLLSDLLVQGVDARLCGGDIGAGLGERSLVIARVDPREHLAGLDRLVVVDRHLGDIARHLGTDQHRMRLHIGVIGRHQKAAGRPVEIAINGSRRQKHQRRGRDQQALQ